MMSRIIACLMLTTAWLCAENAYPTCTFFAPYDGPYPVSLDVRFDGYPCHHPSFKCHHKNNASYLRNSFALNGYVRLPNNFFYTIGTFLGAGEHNYLRMADVNIQIGKYWTGVGALRGGLMYTGVGVGGDFWLIHKDQFKWLTTLEGGARSDCTLSHNFQERRFRPFARWLNRIFPFHNSYISFGIDHIHRSYSIGSITQGFIGFGSSI